jgi:hypothetical protein
MEDMRGSDVASMSSSDLVNILDLKIKESFRSLFHFGSADILKVKANSFDLIRRHVGDEVRPCTSGPTAPSQMSFTEEIQWNKGGGTTPTRLTMN